MRRSARGFSLLEAIVALAILAAGAMALFSALNGALRAQDRVEASVRTATAVDNAVALLESVNVMEQPRGESTIGDYRFRWMANPIAGPVDVLTDYYRPGLHQVVLYDVEVEVWSAGAMERRFTLRRIGWQQVREPAAL